MPQRMPRRVSAWAIHQAEEVLPLVPVQATTRRRALGCAHEAAGDGPGAGLESGQRGDARRPEARSSSALGLDQAGDGAGRERRRHVGARVVGVAGPGDEGVAGTHAAAVGGERRGAAQHQPVHRCVGRGESHQRHQKLSTSAGISWATICGLTSRSGCTPIIRRVCCTTWLNTGAATSPPYYLPAVGSSTITATMMRGCVDRRHADEPGAVFLLGVALAFLLVGRAALAADRVAHHLGLRRGAAGRRGQMQHARGRSAAVLAESTRTPPTGVSATAVLRLVIVTGISSPSCAKTV